MKDKARLTVTLLGILVALGGCSGPTSPYSTAGEIAPPAPAVSWLESWS